MQSHFEKRSQTQHLRLLLQYSRIQHYLPLLQVPSTLGIPNQEFSCSQAVRVAPQTDQCGRLCTNVMRQCSLISRISNLVLPEWDALGEFHQGLQGDTGTHSFRRMANLRQMSIREIWIKTQVLHFPLPQEPSSFLGTQGPGTIQSSHQLPQQYVQ